MSKVNYQVQRINGKKNYVHRHVMEAYLGRALAQNEHVYHKDGDHRNNDIDNLVVIIKKSWK